MKTTKKTRPGQRWLGVGFVLAAVVVVVGIKAINRPDQVAGLRVAETPGPAVAPTLRAESPGSNVVSSGSVQEADPFPSEPEAQIEWVLRNRRPAMILFHSTTCKPCQLMEKAVDKVRTEYELQIAFIDVVVTDPANATLVRQAQIRTIPTSIFVTASGDAYGFVGAVEEHVLRTELTKLISGES